MPDNDTYLKYYIKVNSGKLETSIKSPQKVILNQEYSAVIMDSIHLVNQKGARYKIHFQGKQAAGEFDIRFTDSPN